MKKKILCSVVIIGVIAMFGLLYVSGGKREYDEENQCTVVTGDRWNDYTYAVYKDYVELLEYTGEEQEVVVPKKIKGKPVTVIGEQCFEQTDIHSVELSENIKEIKYSAFGACENLVKVTGEATLTQVANTAFLGCRKLQKVEIGNSVTKIEALAFACCEQLESIGHQPMLNYIGNSAFEEAGLLTDLEIQPTTEVGERAMSHSKWLENRTEEFVIIGTGNLVAYRGSSEIVKIPDGVIKVDNPFEYCENCDAIKEVYIPNSVTELYYGVFYPLENVTVYIPDSVTAIAKNLPNNPYIINNPETLTIVTTSGSYAEEFAKEWGIKCVIVESW